MPREQVEQVAKVWAQETLCAHEMVAKISKGVRGREESEGCVAGISAGATLSAGSTTVFNALRTEVSNTRDLMRCPRKLFLHDRLQALHARNVQS